jgi:hypothetical protein
MHLAGSLLTRPDDGRSNGDLFSCRPRSSTRLPPRLGKADSPTLKNNPGKTKVVHDRIADPMLRPQAWSDLVYIGGATRLGGCALVEFSQQRPGFLEVERVEALDKPSIYWREEVVSFAMPALIVPESSKGGCSTQLK